MALTNRQGKQKMDRAQRLPYKDLMHTNHTVIILHNQVQDNAPEDVLDIVRQAHWIAEILQAKGYDAHLLPFSLQNLEVLVQNQKQSPILVFNLVDSAPGEERLAYLVPGLLEQLHLNYTGCSLDALYQTTNKVLAKRMLQAGGIDTPLWVSRSETQALKTIHSGRFLIKPTGEDASIGLDESCLVDVNQVLSTLEIKENQLKKACFAEQFIDGREFTACMYGTRHDCIVLPPYEWVFKEYEENHKAKIITYDAKWTEDTFGYNHIEPKYTIEHADEDLVQNLIAIAKKCWDIFSLQGYARVDFRIDREGKPWVLEVNCNPSFYGFYHLANENNLTFEDIVTSLVEQAVSS